MSAIVSPSSLPKLLMGLLLQHHQRVVWKLPTSFMHSHTFPGQVFGSKLHSAHRTVVQGAVTLGPQRAWLPCKDFRSLVCYMSNRRLTPRATNCLILCSARTENSHLKKASSSERLHLIPNFTVPQAWRLPPVGALDCLSSI